MQTSESFKIGAILSFSGGLQDAYTYNVRGNVFANAQTGNVVLMSQNLMSGDFHGCLQYIFPLMAFAAGVFSTELLEHKFKTGERIHWRQLVLLSEMVLLGIVGFLPAGADTAANMLVSFACAMQVQAFRKVHGYGYASTMCIGNLRSGTESLAHYLRDGDRASIVKARHFFGIILAFAIGAGTGGVLSGALGLRTIWVSLVLLAVVVAMMTKRDR